MLIFSSGKIMHVDLQLRHREADLVKNIICSLSESMGICCSRKLSQFTVDTIMIVIHCS